MLEIFTNMKKSSKKEEESYNDYLYMDQIMILVVLIATLSKGSIRLVVWVIVVVVVVVVWVVVWVLVLLTSSSSNHNNVDSSGMI